MPNSTQCLNYPKNHYAVFPFVFTPFVSYLSLAKLQNSEHTTQKNSQVIHQAFLPSTNYQPKNFAKITWYAIEALQVCWLIERFNDWFKHYDTQLVKGNHEPEYFAKKQNTPAKIVFAHGFFASALHEISHWCVAGKKRRSLDDFGYWYAPDGRSEEQQRQFEQVEIVPQAIECLLSLTCNKPFRVSTDNLSANFDNSQSKFAQDVSVQAYNFWQTGEKLPSDAKLLLKYLEKLRPLPLTLFDIRRNFSQGKLVSD